MARSAQSPAPSPEPVSADQNLLSTLLTKFWPSNTACDRVLGIGFLLFVITFFVLGVFMPGYGYDLIPYLGTVFQANGESIAEVHQNAWGAVKQVAQPDVYERLSQDDAYRQVQSTDPVAFNSILPLYSAKIGYLYLLKALGSVFGWVNSALWVSHLSSLCIGLFALFWMWKARFLQAAPLVAGIFLLGNYFDEIRYSSPDVVAALLTVIGAYIWLRGRETVALVLFALAFAFRPDTLLFVFALILATAVFRLSFWRPALAFLGLMVASVVIAKATHHPGWWTHFYFSCVTIQPTLEGFHPDFSLFAYIKGVARGLFMSLTEFNWPTLLIAVCFGTVILARAGFNFTTKQWALWTACFLAIGGKFIVFPLPDDRIYMPLLLIMSMIALEVWKPQVGANR